MKQLPLHPRPLPDELLSSWATRLALSNGLFNQGLHRNVLNLDSSVSTRNLDSFFNEKFVGALSTVTSESVAEIKSLMLSSYSGRISETVVSNANSRWILPLGLFHRTHKLNGVLCCPECLKTDQTPYFRKYWRLSFYTMCHIHKNVMIDQCPHCHAVINYERTAVSNRTYDLPLNHVGQCWNCFQPLWFDKSEGLGKSNQSHLTDLLLAFEKQFVDNDARGFGNGLSHELLLFNGLGVIAASLLRKRSSEVLNALLDSLGVSGLSQLENSPTFDMLPIAQRHVFFQTLLWLIDDWPERLNGVHKLGKYAKSAFPSYKSSIPFWVDSVASSLLHEGQYYPTDEELKVAWKILKMAKPSEQIFARDLSRLTGVHLTTCREKINKLKLR